MIAAANRSRIHKLSTVLDAEGVDAYFAWSALTMGYLHGFWEGAYERFLLLAISPKGDVRLICPALSESQARRSGIDDVHSWRDGEDPLVHLQRLVDDWHIRTGIVAVDAEMPARLLLTLQAALPATLFKSGDSLISRLMRNKDEAELDAMRRAGKIADDAFDAVISQMHEGMTERELDAIIQKEMSARGGRPDFCIVAAGANSAEPHHLSDDTVIRRGELISLDFGCTVDGYRSDITRAVALGDVPDEAKKIYEIVYKAQAAGRAAIQSGVTPQDIDRTTRKVIEDAGYGEFFVHRTGHGIGMQGHEDPYIVEGNEEPLEPGQCFSVEPGIYIPGKYGVRIENIVACTEYGHESLNREPSETLRII